MDRGLESSLILSSSKNGETNATNIIDWNDILNELKKQIKLAGPLIIVSFLQFSLQIISVMFIGHVSELSLAGASLATSFSGVTSFSLMLGMGGALETLCGQAYGAKEYYMLGIYLQRSVLVLMIMAIPLAFIMGFTQNILIFCGQDVEISFEAGTYAIWLIPCIFPYGILQCQLRFLQAQNVVSPLTFTTGLSTIFHILLCWLFVFELEFGAKGAAISIAISYWVNVFLLAAYIRFSGSCRNTWNGFSMEGLNDLFGFLSLGIPSALMICLEFWSYEFLVLMSGLLPNPQLETSMMTISLNTSALVFRIPYGLGSAISTRVSNELGAGQPYAARLAVFVVLFLSAIEGLIGSLVAVWVRNFWGYMFTNEEEVVNYMAYIMPLLAASNFIDGIQAVFSGVARGCGWQKIGAYVNLGAYYLIGLPAAVFLTFIIKVGGQGLWIGIMFGSSFQAVLLLVITMKLDWELQAKKARERIYFGSLPIDISSSINISVFIKDLRDEIEGEGKESWAMVNVPRVSSPDKESELSIQVSLRPEPIFSFLVGSHIISSIHSSSEEASLGTNVFRQFFLEAIAPMHLEFWSYEFLVLMSGLLPNPQLETSMMTISLNTSALVFRIPYGLGSAISTRVSNELGAGQPYAARLAVFVVLFLSAIEGLIGSLVAVWVRNFWGYMFTNEEEVVNYMAYIMPLLAASNFIDGIQAVFSGRL
ncbi:protein DETOXIFICATION 16-like [Impatiens glandulifera]|uniref:protein DETOXIFICATION 16-like n=1 Tax=Impatiens glandulifera TaxID=253017 RepID=UPI001FB11164|nr:protein DETOXIFICATION 16-like [Impatiens glandulifera]